MKRVVIISDLHAGHCAGLTPQEYQWRDMGDKTAISQWARIQKELNNLYDDIVEKYYRPDILIVNGDAIDGAGRASRGRELITSDPFVQIEIAETSIKKWDAKKYIVMAGTPYHTGQISDYERKIAEDLNGSFFSTLFLGVEGVMFDIKHKIGRSSSPYGQGTILEKAAVFNSLLYERNMEPRADIIIRSHIHFHRYVGGNKWLAMTTPALQATSIYGDREVEGYVDWGIVVFNVDGRSFTWKTESIMIETAKRPILRVK